MTRMSKQARRRAKNPKKRKPKYGIVYPPLAPKIAYKEHHNVINSTSIFIPKIG
ncbi:hypothetical protein [Candidatus Chlamydia sanziniae]|uniref:Uncharacterized protein n=1 Tax=Candidatus Chlamydia sanziniae TaxID=1806891 RepID=A0A1A9HV71_9CHLA|nr:hypothetical protein [Candidatus Chlamydia sanziniae]ANH78301.1 hypothetical protein Cs308_0130 [Candidatus Chlamydia sanziniae]